MNLNWKQILVGSATIALGIAVLAPIMAAIFSPITGKIVGSINKAYTGQASA